MKRSTGIEFLVLTLFALGLFLPFLAIQYDTNGIIEAMAVEAGPLLNKNHMLYRPAALLVWRMSQFAGYTGNSLPVLQAINAVAGAIGVGLSFLAFKRVSADRTAACVATAWLATSFTYWIFATDAAYITVAGMFAAAAMACMIHARSIRWIVAAGVFASLGIFTWQANIFLIPALLFLLPRESLTSRRVCVFLFTAGLIVALVYVCVGVGSNGWMSPREFWTWFSNYSENATLPIWGSGSADRIPVAAVSALNSVTPVLLAAGVHELLHPVQLGRVAIDFAVLAFGMLLVLAASKARGNALRFLAGYLCFVPFIVWWDPSVHKWFFVPNLFLAGFLACGLAPWLERKYTAVAVIGCMLVISAANFITTIRPRHFDVGKERRMAQCVAEHMQPADLFVAAEWGWPDYLEYLHARKAINLINESAYYRSAERTLPAVQEHIKETQRNGATVYMADPRSHAESHIHWLETSTGLTLKELLEFGGAQSFDCEGIGIRVLR